MSGLRRQRSPRFWKPIRIVRNGGDADSNLPHHISLVAMELAQLQIARRRRMRFEGPCLSVTIKASEVGFAAADRTLHQGRRISDAHHMQRGEASNTHAV